MVALRPHGEERAPRVLVSVAVVAVAALDALYLSIVAGQGGFPSDQPLVVPFVAGYLAAAAICLAISLFVPVAPRAALRGAAAGGLLVLAVLSAFSIGVGVLIPAALSIGATVRTVWRHPQRSTVVSAVAGIVVGVAVLLIGLQLVWQQIVCPATGEGGGTVPTFFGVGASYDCNNGVLTVHR